MDQKTDAVIIGSGLNSLACAMVLQSRGWRVLICEQAAEIGGAVKTGAYTAEGFRHDWAAMNLSLFAGSPFFQRFQTELTAAGLSFVPAERCFATAFGDDTWLGITNDRSRNAKNISAFANNDGEAWGALSDQFPARSEHIFALLGAPFKFWPLAKILWRLWRKEGTRGALELLRFLLSSPRSWLDDTFESAQVKSTLAVWGMHLDFAPDIAGGAVFPYLEAMANQSFGMVIGAGGADTIIKAMVACIEGAGGRIWTNAPVTDVLIEGGKATGVGLADGRICQAQRAVIANVAVGKSPFALAASPAGDRLYVANVKSGDLTVLSTSGLQQLETVKTGNMPYGVAVTPDGSKAVVANQQSGSVDFVDTQILEVVQRIGVGRYPESVAILPDGAKAYIINWFSGDISVLNPETGEELTRIDVGDGARSLAVIDAPEEPASQTN